jgi:nitroreductase
MVRSFSTMPVPPDVVDRVLANAQRAPSAGFTQGWAFVVLEGDGTDVFWRHVAEPTWRASPTWAGLLRAPVIILPLSSEQAYRDRYAEPDKADVTTDWPVPYWDVDTGMAALLMLLTAVDGGLGASFIRIGRGQAGLVAALGIPATYRPIGAIALGFADGQDRPSSSLSRGRRPAAEVVHRGRWQAGSR